MNIEILQFLQKTWVCILIGKKKKKKKKLYLTNTKWILPDVKSKIIGSLKFELKTCKKPSNFAYDMNEQG